MSSTKKTGGGIICPNNGGQSLLLETNIIFAVLFGVTSGAKLWTCFFFQVFTITYGKITISYKPCFVTVPTHPAESTAVITYQKPAWASHVLIDPFDWLNVPSALHGPGDRKDRYSPTRWNDWSSSKTSSLLSPKQNTPAEEKSGIMIRFKRLVTAPAGQQHSNGNEGQQIGNITRPPYQVCVSLYYARDIMRMWLKAFQRQIKLTSWWDSHFNIYSISAESQRHRTDRRENLLAGQKKA